MQSKDSYKGGIPDEQLLKFSEYKKSDRLILGDKPKSIYIFDGQNYIIKGHNNDECLGLEIIAAKIFSLTGLTAPYTIFAKNFEKDKPDLTGGSDIFGADDISGSTDIYGNADDLKADSAPANPDIYGKPYLLDRYSIASKMLDNYMDFSSFVHFVNKHKEKLISPENIESFNKYYEELKRINENKTELPAKLKVQRRDVLLKLYELYPEDIRNSFEEMYAVSIWIGNWDILNFELENCGFCAYEKEDGTLSIKPAMVDFGNCLYTGFGGKHKEDSLNRANERAKNEKNNPDNYDPVMPVENKIPEEAAAFGKECEMIRLSNIPRRQSFEELFKKTDDKICEILSNNQQNSPQLISNGFLRGIYRISLISDEAIEKTVRYWFHFDKDIDFLNKDKKYSEQDLINTLMARRDHLSRVFAQQIVQAKINHPEEFLAVEKKMYEINNKFINNGTLKKHKESFSWVAYIFNNEKGNILPNQLPNNFANFRINNHHHQNGCHNRT